MNRREEFFIEGHKPSRILFRDVWPARGRPYRHTCDEAVFKKVLRAIDDTNGYPFTGEQLVERTGCPHTQVFVAYAFLKDGLLEQAHRRHWMYSSIFDIEMDGMCEFEALAHSGERR